MTKSNGKLNGYYTRKLRRAIAKAEGTAFEPVYNGAEPITFAEHLANFKTDYKSGKTLAPRSKRLSPLNKAEVSANEAD